MATRLLTYWSRLSPQGRGDIMFCPMCGSDLGTWGGGSCAHVAYWWSPDPDRDTDADVFPGEAHPLRGALGDFASFWAPVVEEWLYPSDALVETATGNEQEERAQARLEAVVDKARSQIPPLGFYGDANDWVPGLLGLVAHEDVFLDYMPVEATPDSFRAAAQGWAESLLKPLLCGCRSTSRAAG